MKGWTGEITKDFMENVFEESFLELAYPSLGAYEAGPDDGVIITDDELKAIGFYEKNEPCPECETDREPIPEWYDEYLNPDNDFSDYRDYHELEAISNNWVIGGNKTASGHPILANDPHLPNMLPGFWHPFSMHYKNKKGDATYVIGAGFVGGPICPIGRSKDLTWGVTIGAHDQADVYEERITGQ